MKHPVHSNQAPAAMSELVRATRKGELSRAQEVHYRLLPLMRANFLESNPVPVKTAMHPLGFCSAVLRAPLGAAEESTVAALRSALASAGIESLRG